jgi:putative PLP-dependent aminotransferase (TIGR04422 family)
VRNSSGELIEDSVDSLYVPGAQLLTEGGRFEIWSLSKILGTIGGGVLWCRDPNDAEVVKKCVQTSRTHANLGWFLKAMTLNGKAKLAEVWWSASETATDGAPSRLLISETASRLQSWPQLVEQRTRRVKQVVDANVGLLEAPDLQSRIPCLLPVAAEEDQIAKLKLLGLPQSRRHFLDRGGRIMLAYPLPIHQGISDKTLRTALQVLCK